MINIRKMLLDDLEQIRQIEARSFPAPWSKEQISAEIGNIALVAEDGRIVGYLFARQVLDEVELLSLAVVPESRGQGIGKRLLSELIALVKAGQAVKIFLEVRESNSSAIRLYEKTGFRRFSIRKAYYQDGEDAVVMECAIQ